MVSFFRRLLPMLAGVLLAPASGVLAQEVILRSADGGVALEGTLLDYDGEFYRLDTRFGELTLRALGVICTGEACPDRGQYAADITLSGAGLALQRLLAGLIEDFAYSSGLTARRDGDAPGDWTYFLADSRAVPVARMNARPGDSAAGFTDLIDGEADIAVTTRLPGSAEIAAAGKAGTVDLTDRFQRRIVALDGLVFLVSRDNPVTALSLDQIARIYAGAITNWSELGGYDAPITLMRRRPDSDIGRFFFRRLLPPASGRKPAPAQDFDSDEALSDAVASNPFAIGFAPFSAIRNARALGIRGDCGATQYPSAFGLQSGDYPLVRPVWLFTPRRRLPVVARDFLAWLTSPQAERPIASLGFASPGLTAQTLAEQTGRVANAVAHADSDVTLEALRGFVKAFGGARRLSATFRFKDGTVIMDARSKRNIDSLARLIETGDFDGRELIFAGFTDSRGGADGNRKISRQRAEEVAKMIREAAIRADLSKIRFRAVGMGEVSPLACNDTASGRHTNRRVEVWMR